MNKGLFLTQQLEVVIKQASINYSATKGLPSPPIMNSKIRILSIHKSFDFYKFSDDEIEKIKSGIKKILGDTLTQYKFILAFEKEESIVTNDIINLFKSILDNAECLVLTINLDIIKPNEIVFLNNPSWIHCDLDRPVFFEMWKYLKTKDLGTIKKKFMFLNNHYSEIRFDILKFIYKNKFNVEGNISFNEIQFDAQHIGLDKEKFLKEVEHFGIEYPKSYDALPTLTQLNEDILNRTKILGINHVTTLPDFNYRIYLESFFEILTETQPHLLLPGVHISEKIHKPLRTGFPFVYYGNPNLKTILEKIGLTFESPIYFFGLDKEELLNHLYFLLTQDQIWYHQTQLKYLEEYLNNMDKWNDFVRNNNKQILKFMFI